MKSVEDSILTRPFSLLFWMLIVFAVVIISLILAGEVMRYSRRICRKQNKQYDIIGMSGGLSPGQDSQPVMTSSAPPFSP